MGKESSSGCSFRSAPARVVFGFLCFVALAIGPNLSASTRSGGNHSEPPVALSGEKGARNQSFAETAGSLVAASPSQTGQTPADTLWQYTEEASLTADQRARTATLQSYKSIHLNWDGLSGLLR